MFAYCGSNPVVRVDKQGYRHEYVRIWGGHEDVHIEDSGEIQVQPPKEVDITERLNQAMREHAEEMQDILQNKGIGTALLTFYNKENYGGEWDLKTSWDLKSDVVYLYRGMRLNKNDIGNIHYGYVGSSCFYSDMLLRAAGLAQFLLSDFEWSNWQTFFDEPRDQEAIKYGITLWEEGLV